MTTKQEVGAKLASSVRQAKAQQTEQNKPKVQPTPSVKAEAPIPLMPSQRVWPD